MVTVRMCRGDLSTSWGFCLEHPGVINQIVGGSLADRAGLQNGDILDEIQGERSPSLSSALRLLDIAKYEIELVVLRDPSASRIWRPQITAEDVVISKFQHSVHNVPPSEKRAPSAAPIVKVSLEHQAPPSVQVPGFNATPKAFSPAMETNGRSHASTNLRSPVEKSYPVATTPEANMPFQTKAEKYLMETGGLFGTDPKVLKAREHGGFINSEALKLIREEEQIRGPLPKSPDAITSREPNVGQGLPHCFICDRSILGLMCKVFDVALHPDCFQCSTCGTSLRNQGHHFLNEKFYCDVHGRQRKAQLGAIQNIGKSFEKVSLADKPPTTTNLDPDLAVRTPPTAAHPMRVQEPPKATYQPNVMTTQPFLASKSST
uniref:PDZ and LIM domain protein Zasp n=1 Tax=Acrobeloides nanus TaxID=290746 RepID=A0A914CK93_9BILA